MKAMNMAAEGSEYFEIGSEVWCKTFHDHVHEGQVVAFEPQTKMLILRCPSSCGDQTRNDLHMINVTLVQDLQVKSELPSSAPALNNLDISQLNSRVKQEVVKKQKILSSMVANVPAEARSLYLAVAKTLDEVEWKGQDICIMNDVTISPPYQADNVKGDNEKCVTHVKKIVGKFWTDNRD